VLEYKLSLYGLVNDGTITDTAMLNYWRDDSGDVGHLVCPRIMYNPKLLNMVKSSVSLQSYKDIELEGEDTPGESSEGVDGECV